MKEELAEERRKRVIAEENSKSVLALAEQKEEVAKDIQKTMKDKLIEFETLKLDLQEAGKQA